MLIGSAVDWPHGTLSVPGVLTGFCVTVTRSVDCA